MMDLSGRTLAGRYAVESPIGHGGMADVYRGIDTLLERPLAIKILTERSDAVVDRFLREAKAMARFNHPNIVAVYDAGQTDGVSYIVMELVDGRTLAQIPPGELTTHTAIRHFIELLEALAYAHDEGVIHRDIKPANVMVTATGTVKVMDFGLSRRTSEMSNETNAGEIVGTLAYLAPERFLGKRADPRSDLYSVGIMMYEIFTGRVPFRSATDDLVSVIFSHVNDVPPSLRTINRAVPPQIDRIVLKLLQKDPDARYGSARELAAELGALIGEGPAPASAPASAGPPPGAPRTREHAGPPPSSRNAATHEAVRHALDRTFGNSTLLNAGYSNTLAGMLATRKRDYAEAARTYLLAIRAFKEGRNEIEHVKTTLKYAAMILQKNGEAPRANRREIDEAAEMLRAVLPGIRGQRMLKELEEGERVLYALQRLGMRLT